MHAHRSMSVRIGKSRDIQALYWCPGVIVSHLYFPLNIFYKQPQSIRPIWDVLQCEVCMLARMSGMGANRGKAPHALDTILDC